MRRDRHRPVPVAVLDASAILALTLGERGANVVAAAVRRAAVASVVNVAEVLTKAVERGLEPEREALAIAEHQIEVMPLLPDDAEPIAKLQAVAMERDVSIVARGSGLPRACQ